jgi:hypothetical protein
MSHKKKKYSRYAGAHTADSGKSLGGPFSSVSDSPLKIQRIKIMTQRPTLCYLFLHNLVSHQRSFSNRTNTDIHNAKAIKKED